MKINVGRVDRIIRVVLGVVLAALGLFTEASGVWPYVSLGVGILLIITGAIGFCPLYALLKLNTVKK